MTVLEDVRDADVATRTWFVVLRPFHGAGVTRACGEIVDGTDWRMAGHLQHSRHIRPLLATDPAPVESEGRYFLSEDQAKANFDPTPIAMDGEVVPNLMTGEHIAGVSETSSFSASQSFAMAKSLGTLFVSSTSPQEG